MGGSHYSFPCSILSTGKDRKTPQRYPDVPTTSWRISIRSMDSQYEDEGWNDAFIPVEMSLNYENPDIEQLLGIMESKVDTLMKEAISLMGRSESIFRITINEMYQPPSKPSRQEEFEHIVMNFILDQEERVKYNPEHLGVRFRLGGEQKEISLLKLGWRIGLYSERQPRENATLSGLRNSNTVKESHLLIEFWPTIGEGGLM
ncbi:hypothetical protein Tco_0524069 [Tanacetum coccineum]